ncbi:MAG TPA: hypothetical protein VET85_16375 [Stellaceae bacterium]|nr:hypothetical protein [Stellaceae bacterium]
METVNRKTANRSVIGKALLALAVAGIFGGAATAPARADDDHWRGRERHERHDRDWHRRGVYVEPYPAYVYAPPPVVYAPPPPLGLNLIFPLHFR